MEVGPTTHYMMGGIRVDAETGATTRAGLFAAGEVAGGMHGANRLGGNSLSDLLVFGQRTGRRRGGVTRRAATTSRALDPAAVQAALAELGGAVRRERRDGESPYRLHEELQATMQSLVGIFRTEADLDEAIATLDALRDALAAASASPAAAPSTRRWNLVFELRNMLDRVRGGRPQRPPARGEPRRPQPARLPGARREVGQEEQRRPARRRRRWRSRRRSCPTMPDELRSLIAKE